MREFGEKLDGIEYSRRPSSYGVILENGRFGVVRSRRLNSYFLIGGGIEQSETEVETLRREALEEIGFEIEIGAKIGAAVECFYAEIDDKHFAKECVFYRVFLLNKISDLSESELVWIRESELGEMYHLSHGWIIREALKSI